MLRPRSTAALFASLLVLAAAPAQAGEAERIQAEQLFQKAVELTKAGKHAEACPVLEESDRLDPQPGVEYELAKCYEETRRPASAWSRYLEVAGKLDARGEAAKADKVRKRVAEVIEPRLIRLTVVVPPEVAAAPGLAITRDGVPVGRAAWGTPVPVDPGVHVVRVTATGKDAWEASRDLTTPGAPVEVRVPALRDADAAAPPAAPPPRPAPPPGWPAQRTAALVAGALGVVSLAVGAGLGAAALGKDAAWNEKVGASCDPTHAACKATAIDAIQGLERSRAAFAHGSTAAFVVGGAGLAAGLTLWLTAPVRVAPVVGAGAAGLELYGTF